MKKFAVIGYPIKHSKSPQLHEAGFIDLEIDATFEAVEVHPDNLETWMREEFPNYEGIAVTIPHKESIKKYIDQAAPAAQTIGAVNTLYRKNGIVIGTNTDCLGALKAIETECQQLKGRRVLILGAGGASRAIIFAMQAAECKASLWNRTTEKASALASHFEITHIESLEDVTGQDFDIIINTTSVGLKSWKSPVESGFFHASNIVFDVVYDPLETKFLSDADAVGAITITGDKMLIFQALEQFKLWHGVTLELEVMANAFFKED